MTIRSWTKILFSCDCSERIVYTAGRSNFLGRAKNVNPFLFRTILEFRKWGEVGINSCATHQCACQRRPRHDSLGMICPDQGRTSLIPNVLSPARSPIYTSQSHETTHALFLTKCASTIFPRVCSPIRPRLSSWAISIRFDARKGELLVLPPLVQRTKEGWHTFIGWEQSLSTQNRQSWDQLHDLVLSAVAKAFRVQGRRLEMPSHAHDLMQAMRRVILWEAWAMIIASPDGRASDLRRDLDNWEAVWIVQLRMESGEVGRVDRAWIETRRSESTRRDCACRGVNDAYSGHFVDVLGLRQGNWNGQVSNPRRWGQTTTFRVDSPSSSWSCDDRLFVRTTVNCAGLMGTVQEREFLTLTAR
jgi:hypothetical protein